MTEEGSVYVNSVFLASKRVIYALIIQRLRLNIKFTYKLYNLIYININMKFVRSQ